MNCAPGGGAKWRRDPNSHDCSADQFGVREMTLPFTLDLTAEAETERTARLQAATAQYWRLKVLGAALGGSNYKIQIDGAYENLEPMASGSDDEGQSSIDLKYTGIHDATKRAAFEIIVVNTLTAIP